MKKKLGPLPRWAWLAIVAGAVALYMYERRKSEQVMAGAAVGAGDGPDADRHPGDVGTQAGAAAHPYPGGYGGRPVYQGPSWTQIQQWLTKWWNQRRHDDGHGHGKGHGDGKGGGHSTGFPPSSVANAEWQIWHLRSQLIGADKDKRERIHKEIALLKRWLAQHHHDPATAGPSTTPGAAASRAASHRQPMLLPAERFAYGGESIDFAPAAPAADTNYPEVFPAGGPVVGGLL